MSERFLIQNWRYPYIGLISVRKEATKQTDRHTRKSEIFGTRVPKSQEFLREIYERDHPELELLLYLYNFSREVSQLTDCGHTRNSELF